MAEMTFLPDAITDKIGYVIKTIEKEARKEDILIRQVLYVMLSMYSNDPRNLMINAPTGEGKSYTIRKVADVFPKEDVIKFIGMTEKSLFHMPGKSVIKNENTGEYEDVDEIIRKIDEQIGEKLEEQKASNKNDAIYKILNENIKSLEEEKKQVHRHSKKLIDLNHKCIILLDTPGQALLNIIMPLLSHDEWEVEYQYTDTNNGIRSKCNVLRGWPVVISSQAIDFSHYTRYPEIKRRFIVANPRMDKEKYQAAVDLTFDKYCLPDFAYQKKVVSDDEKDQAREIINGFKERIIDIFTAVRPGRSNVFIPFEAAIKDSIVGTKASDITNADRICSWLTLLAAVNVEERPFIHFRRHGSPTLQKIPLATFADLKEALSLKPYVSGASPYILDWYYDVFLSHDFSGKQSFVTTRELSTATEKIKGKTISPRRIRETYLTQLINEGYVDSVRSEEDKRTDVYYPVITDKLGEKENTYISAQSPNFPAQIVIRSSIQALLAICNGEGVPEINNIDIDDIVTKYYNNPEEVFTIKWLNPVLLLLYYSIINKTQSTSASSSYYTNGVQNEEIEAKEGEKKEIDEKCMYSPNLLSLTEDSEVLKDIREESWTAKTITSNEQVNKTDSQPDFNFGDYQCFYCDHCFTSDDNRRLHRGTAHPEQLDYPEAENFMYRLIPNRRTEK